MHRVFKIPFYARAALISIGLFAFVFAMYIGRDIIVPIVFESIIAIVLNPFVELLRKWRLNRVMAIAVAVIVAALSILAVMYIVHITWLNSANH